jgi:glycosyltransferase involved in cell wall biosynthesis
VHAPKTSVILTSFNHGRYVGEAIASVLWQTDSNFELIIADDCSTDDSWDIINSYKDPRIRLFRSEKTERGLINKVLKAGVVRGEYVAIHHSDDIWENTKLEKQVEFLDNHFKVGAVFSRANFIDEEGNDVVGEAVPQGTTFNQDNKSRGGWLKDFFLNGNSLCHPTIMIRRECYEKIGLYNNIYRQLPDFDMWIRLVKNYDIHVSSEKLTDFRILPGRNASSPTTENIIRDLNEHYLIRRSFFKNISTTDLKEGFGSYLIQKEVKNRVQVEIETALLYFLEEGKYSKINKLIGLEKMEHLMMDREKAEIMDQEYGINASFFHKKSGEVSTIFESMIYRPGAPRKHTITERIIQVFRGFNESESRKKTSRKSL